MGRGVRRVAQPVGDQVETEGFPAKNPFTAFKESGASPEMARALFENAQDAILILEDGVFVECNPRAADVFGHDRSEIVGAEPADLSPQLQPDGGNSSVLAERGMNAALGGEPQFFQWRHLRRNGQEFDAEVSLNRIDHDGCSFLLAVVRDVTERRRAEASLQRSEQFLRSTFESLSGMIVVLDRKLRVILCNWKDHEFITEEEKRFSPQCYRVFKRLSEPCPGCRVLKTFEDGKARTYEDRNPVDGAFKEIRITPIFDQDGRVSHVIEHVQDITERRRDLERIDHLNRVLRAIRKVNQLIAEESDRDALLAGVCEALVSTRGYHNAWIALMDEEGGLRAASQSGLNGEQEQVSKLFERGGMTRCAREALRGEGLQVALDPESDCSGCPLSYRYEGRAGMCARLESGGKVLGVITVSIPAAQAREPEEQELFREMASDLSLGLRRIELEKERAEHLEALKKYELIVSTVRDPMCFVDRDYVYRSVNNAYLDKFGKPREEIEGHSVASLLGEEAFREQVKPRLDLALAGEEVHYEDWFDLPDGRRAYREMSYYPYFGEEGKVQGVVANANDLTEHKLLLEDLEASKAAAEAANVAKSEFLANMSHEIRTPLNGVLGTMQLLRMTALDHEQRDLVDTALYSGKNLMDIIGDILDLSRVESGTMVLEEEPFEPGRIVKSAVEAFRGTANEKGVPLIFEPGPDLPAELIGDSGRLRQVLFNVVGNAVKFTEHGRIRVEAVRLKGGINKARLLFSISDTGCGIAEDKLDHIFKPFTQADGSHTRRYQGTGLGLAIVKRLVTLMGGNVHFESEEGRGTTFYLRLDFAVPEPAAEDGISAGEETAGAGDKSGLDVLVVEDDAVNRLTVTRFLEKLGHRAVSAENGAKALEALREGSFDLVLMDIQMPEMDGMEATRRIRAGEADAPAGIPIVAVTAHAMKGDREKFLEVGMNGYLSKPVDIKDLERALNEAAGLESAASD